MQQRITPKVSVCVLTYNHEKYIRQCLQSIVDQETDFDFEVIVGDDCSLDGTRVIVQEFAEQYPEIVKPIFHEKNIGGTKNYFSVHDSAKGEYVAHCDGDDYWLPNKLIYQVRLLDERQHLVFIADYIGGKKKLDAEVMEYDSRKLFTDNNPVLHSSKLYRARYKIDHIKERDYLDAEISIRQLGTKRCCGLSRKQTTIFRENTDTSIRKFVNARLINTYINFLEFSKSTGIEKREINRMYNVLIKSSIKNAVVLNHGFGVRDIRAVTKRCENRLQAKTALYLLIAQHQGGMRLFRGAIVAKRKLLEFLR